MAQEFFVQRPAVTPTIYVYNLPQVSTHKGYVKVGYTDRDAVTRINEQMHTSGLAANILYTESAMCSCSGARSLANRARSVSNITPA